MRKKRNCPVQIAEAYKCFNVQHYFSIIPTHAKLSLFQVLVKMKTRKFSAILEYSQQAIGFACKEIAFQTQLRVRIIIRVLVSLDYLLTHPQYPQYQECNNAITNNTLRFHTVSPAVHELKKLQNRNNGCQNLKKNKLQQNFS